MFRSRCRFVVALLLSLCAAWSGIPAQAQSSSKLALAHVAPDECIFFLTWNGWTEPDPKSTNRAERLLAEESLKEFIKQLGAEIDKIIDNAVKADGSEHATVVAQAAPVLAKTALTHPGAIYLTSFKPQDNPEIEGAFVVDAQSDGPQAIEAFKKLIALTPKEGPQVAIEEKIGDATFFRPKDYRANEPRFRLGYRGSQLIAALGDDSAKSVVARLSKPGKPAAWLTQTSTDLAVDRPSMLSYFNAQALLKTLQPVITDPMAPKILDLLGVSKLKHWSSVSGLDKTGMQVNSAIITDGKPTGLFDLCPDKPLTIDVFKKIPANAVNATVARFDLAYVFEKVLDGIGEIDSNARQQFEAGMAQSELQLGFSVKKDLLDALGDTWTFYVSGSAAGTGLIPGIVITASVRDHARFSNAHERLVNMVNAALAQFGPQAPFSLQEFSAKGEKGHQIQINNLPLQIAPTWVLTKDQLVIGLTSELVTSHLAAAGKTSLADNESLKAAFKWQPKPVFVSYSDPKPALQGVYTLVNTFGPVLTQQLAQQGINFNLPPLPPLSDLEQHLAPSVTTFGRLPNGWRTESHGVIPDVTGSSPAVIAIGAALLLPAVQQAREAARRAQGKNNLKQIALAMHNFHDTYQAFPAAANVDKKGKKLLSWRVHVLPYVDQAPLYQQFHLDEPWDSEHNKELIKNMPPVYISTNHADLAKEGKTVYLVPTGKGTAFEGSEGLGMREFTDGTSNTILAVEAHRDAAVIWTKPDDLEVDFKNPLKGLKSARVGGFHASLCDGSVRFISDSINVETLKALFTRNGGERINFDAVDAVPARPRPVARPGDPKNNLKQLGLALHIYADTHRHLPQRAVTDKSGKALLSWRVQLLPYLEANDLYQQFHLDEPWDSEHNKTLIDKMPVHFTALGDEELAKQGKTRFVTPSNAEACLGAKEGTRFADIRDGTSNTIMAVEARADAAVIWTKPDDIVIDFKNPLKSLKDARNGGFLAMMCDGSVRVISDKINVDTFKALITRAGGEVLGDF